MRKWACLIGLLLASAAQVVQAQAEEPDQQSEQNAAIVATAAHLIVQHKNEEALAALEPAIASFDTQIAKAREEGLAFCASDMTLAIYYSGLAAAKTTSSVVFGPEVCRAYFLKAYAFAELGRRQEAIATLESLRGLSPMDAEYAIELAFSYVHTGKLAEAEAAYQDALGHAELLSDTKKSKHYKAAALRGLGYVAVEKSDFKAGEKFYRRSLKFEPDSQVAQSELAYIGEHKKH